MKHRKIFTVLTTVSLMIAMTSLSHAQKLPSPAQILQITPCQQDIQIDIPTGEDAEKCRVVSGFQDGDYKGYSLVDGQGTPLRDCCGGPGATTVEQIRFYQNGLEVFRQTLGKEFRCLNTGGSRWAIIDGKQKLVQWKSISAEETTGEIVAALVNNDLERFKKVALTAEDVAALGLAGTIADELNKQIQDIDANFSALSQKLALPANIKWGGMFSSNRPAIIPKGKNSLNVDLPVYYNVSVTVLLKPDSEQGENATSQQIYIGDLVKIGDVWKIVGLPVGEPFGQATGEVAATSLLFPVMQNDGGAPAAGISDDYNDLAQQLSDAYKELENVTPENYAATYEKTIGLMLTLASKNPNEETEWITQAADLIFTAIQSGQYPQGIDKLNELYNMYKENSNPELAALIRLRTIEGEYFSVAQANPAPKRVDLEKAQEKRDADIQAFVDEYPRTLAGSSAMMYLALNQEYLQDADAAIGYYSTIAENFPNDRAGQKATGALQRLQSTGKPFPFPQLNYLEGGSFAPASGKINVIFCWASWGTSDLEEMKQLLQKYPDVNVMGVNFDSGSEDATQHAAAMKALLPTLKLPWKNVCEFGGLDSSVALQLGIQNVPLIILIDAQGNVINPSIQSINELSMALENM